MGKTTYWAEISTVERRILVVVKSPDIDVMFSRSFHNICDAEHWLLRLCRIGLRKQDCSYLLEPHVPAFELPPIGVIRVLDKRVSKRMTLPEVVS
jgi:hypothetical protein